MVTSHLRYVEILAPGYGGQHVMGLTGKDQNSTATWWRERISLPTQGKVLLPSLDAPGQKKKDLKSQGKKDLKKRQRCHQFSFETDCYELIGLGHWSTNSVYHMEPKQREQFLTALTKWHEVEAHRGSAARKAS